jgi:hypothetical protein
VTTTQLTKEEAEAAARRCAFVVVDDLESDEYDPNVGRSIIHCFRGSIGADWDLDSVLRVIERADQWAWADSLFGRCLAVLYDGKVYVFDTVVPA